MVDRRMTLNFVLTDSESFRVHSLFYVGAGTGNSGNVCKPKIRGFHFQGKVRPFLKWGLRSYLSDVCIKNNPINLRAMIIKENIKAGPKLFGLLLLAEGAGFEIARTRATSNGSGKYQLWAGRPYN